MKNNHTWFKEEADLGNLGSETFWTCSICGANGGPTWNHKDGTHRTPDMYWCDGDDCDTHLVRKIMES